MSSDGARHGVDKSFFGLHSKLEVSAGGIDFGGSSKGKLPVPVLVLAISNRCVSQDEKT